VSPLSAIPRRKSLMTDYMTATRALDEIGGAAGWNQEKQIEVLLGFIEHHGMDAAFLTWAIAEAGPDVVPATVAEVRETRKVLADTEPVCVLYEHPDELAGPVELWRGSAEDFTAKNVENLTPKEINQVWNLKRGENFDFGGGAQPRWRLTRVT
jgi:hypothetical protein